MELSLNWYFKLFFLGKNRFIASKMGFMAVKSLMENQKPVVTAFLNGFVEITPFENCLDKKSEYEKPYQDLVRALSI